MTIGEKIKQRRIEMGWSQRELSDRMQYSNHSTITRIEAGKVDVPQSRIIQFAEVLNTTVADLMDWENEEIEQPIDYDGLSEKKKALIDFALSVPEDKASMVLRVLKSIVEDD